ncbi:MAG: hypothetical protein P1R74_00750, partial [Sedimenticola sp.]|nr:hypothetical protein [Sedimenticola sp.]
MTGKMVPSSSGSAVKAVLDVAGGLADTIAKVSAAERKAEIDAKIADASMELDEAQRTALYTPAWDVNDSALSNIKFNRKDRAGADRTHVDGHEIQTQLWDQSVNDISSRYTKGLDPKEAEYFKSKVYGTIRNGTDAIAIASIKGTNRKAREINIDTAHKLVDVGRLDEAIDHINKSTPFTEEEKVDLVEKLQTYDETTQVSSAIRSSDPEVIATALSLLEDENYSGWLTESQRQAAVVDLRRRSDEQRTEFKLEMAQRHEMFYSDFELAVQNGHLKASDIEGAYQQWQDDQSRPDALGPKERTHLHKVAHERFIKQQKIDNNIAEVNQAISGRTILNPANKDDRKAVEDYVTATNPDTATLEKIVVKTGIMPQVIQDKIEGQSINGNISQASDALAIYQRMEDTAPHLIHGIDERAQAILGQASVMVRGGIDPQKAIEISRESLKLAPEQREAREQAYKELKPNNAAALKSMMDADERLFDLNAYYTSDVDYAPGMTAEYDVLTKQYFNLTGDLVVAQKMAYKGIQHTWGISTTGAYIKEGEAKSGPRALKYPPERVFNMSPEQSNAAFTSFAAVYGLDPGKIIIYSDPTTARQLDSWAVGVVDENGLPSIPMNPKTFEPLRYRPGNFIDAVNKTIRDRQQEQLDAARKEREDAKKWDEANIYSGVGFSLPPPRSPT